jgi:hypothetical protein
VHPTSGYDPSIISVILVVVFILKYYCSEFLVGVREGLTNLLMFLPLPVPLRNAVFGTGKIDRPCEAHAFSRAVSNMTSQTT